MSLAGFIAVNVLPGIILVYLAAMILYTYRAIRGPTIPDHVLGVDALSYDLVVMLMAACVMLHSPLLAPVPLLLALWVYALDLYVAKYLEGKGLGG